MSSSAVTPLQMRETYDLTNSAGTNYVLNDGRTRTILQSSGEGTPPTEYLTTSGPLQDGSTLRGFRLRPRTLIYLVRWQGCSREQYQAMRAALMNVVRPNQASPYGTLALLTLRKRTYPSTIRAIDVAIADGPGFQPVSGWDGFGFTETLRFTAFDPTWYNPVSATVSIIPSTSDNLVFPFTFPFVFGSGVISSSTTIAYPGTWPTFPTITIDGPVAGPSITNVTTGEDLVLSSYTVAAGERVTFDLRYGVKSITNNFGVNLGGYISATSDLATFHLEPSPGAPSGNNQISFAGNGATGATAFGISYYARYYGV